MTNTLLVTTQTVFGGNSKLNAYVVLNGIAVIVACADCHDDMRYYAEREGYDGYTIANVDPMLKLGQLQVISQ